MELKEFDEILLDVAYQTFALKRSYFDRLGQKMWANAGVENWVQVELILAFLIRNLPVTTIGKRKRDCDLIINGHAVELRCATAPNSSWLLDAIKKHPKAELYLFLSQTNSKLVNELETYFERNGYIEKYKMLNEKWLVMVIKKKGIALSPAEKVSLVKEKENTDEIRLLQCNKKMHFLRRAREKLALFSRIKPLDWVSVKFEGNAIILQKIEKEKVGSAQNPGEYMVQIDKWGEFKFNNEMLEKVKQMQIAFKEWLSVTFLPERVEIRKKLAEPRQTMDTFLEKLNMVSPELRTRFYEIKKVIEDLWGDRVRLKFPYQNVVDFRIPPPTGTVVSLSIQTRRNRFELYLKFGDEKPNDPRKITEDITRFGFGKLNRRLYFEPQDKVGVLDERGSIANLLKQVHGINP